MKKYLLLVVLFIFIGCAMISFEPVTHPDQRIHLGGFSFLSPSGKNWEVNTDPIEYNLYWKTWGRSTAKANTFKKNIVGPNHASGETEKLKVSVFIYEFGLMKFDNDDDLLVLPQDGYHVYIGTKVGDVRTSKDHFLYSYNFLQLPHHSGEFGKKWILINESRYTLKNINKMNCATSNVKMENVLEISGFEPSKLVHYIYKFICVHPRHPNQIIELRFDHPVLKGYSPTDIQNEIDSFFASLQFH